MCLLQMASALQFIHARGMAHLDVKPDNIYTTKDGRYKLGDFGLASSIKFPGIIVEGDCR